MKHELYQLCAFDLWQIRHIVRVFHYILLKLIMWSAHGSNTSHIILKCHYYPMYITSLNLLGFSEKY